MRPDFEEHAAERRDTHDQPELDHRRDHAAGVGSVLWRDPGQGDGHVGPPSTCPTRPPRASAAAQKLSACARAAPAKLRWIMLKTCGTISAAPAPWSARTTISAWLAGASPHANDAPVKRARPQMNVRPEPKPLPSRAPVISRTA